MSPRPATIDDYRWLYENTDYMQDGLKCARELLPMIKSVSPAKFLDVGGGRGHVSQWIEKYCEDSCSLSWDPSTMGPRHISLTAMMGFWKPDWCLCFDVLEHVSNEREAEGLLAVMAQARRGMMLTIATMSDVHKVRGEDVQLHTLIRRRAWWEAEIRRIVPAKDYLCVEINRDRFYVAVSF